MLENIEIGLADSEFVSLNRNGSLLSLRFLRWNKTYLTVEFSNVIGLKDCLLNSCSRIARQDDSDFLCQALHREYDKIPDQHNYRSYCLFNNDDEVVAEIIASDFRVQPN